MSLSSPSNWTCSMSCRVSWSRPACFKTSVSRAPLNSAVPMAPASQRTRHHSALSQVQNPTTEQVRRGWGRTGLPVQAFDGADLSQLVPPVPGALQGRDYGVLLEALLQVLQREL